MLQQAEQDLKTVVNTRFGFGGELYLEYQKDTQVHVTPQEWDKFIKASKSEFMTGYFYCLKFVDQNIR